MPGLVLKMRPFENLKIALWNDRDAGFNRIERRMVLRMHLEACL